MRTAAFVFIAIVAFVATVMYVLGPDERSAFFKMLRRAVLPVSIGFVVVAVMLFLVLNFNLQVI